MAWATGWHALQIGGDGKGVGLVIAPWQPQIAGTRGDVNLPVVQPPIGQRVLFQQLGVLQHGFAVMPAVVVAPKTAADVSEAAPTHQIPCSSCDGVVGITDVALADARFGPGGG